ncbi:hypothetical protein GCM10027088_73960 [Nocardia goodfellowii]
MRQRAAKNLEPDSDDRIVYQLSWVVPDSNLGTAWGPNAMRGRELRQLLHPSVEPANRARRAALLNTDSWESGGLELEAARGLGGQLNKRGPDG